MYNIVHISGSPFVACLCNLKCGGRMEGEVHVFNRYLKIVKFIYIMKKEN